MDSSNFEIWACPSVQTGYQSKNKKQIENSEEADDIVIISHLIWIFSVCKVICFGLQPERVTLSSSISGQVQQMTQ